MPSVCIVKASDYLKVGKVSSLDVGEVLSLDVGKVTIRICCH